MVKIAARLITIVATVMPERSGLRDRLSEAKRNSTEESPGRLSFDRRNRRAAKLMIAGQNAARPSKNTSMPITPTLNLITEPLTAGALNNNAGDKTKQNMSRRLGHEIFARPAGCQAACRTFSRG